MIGRKKEKDYLLELSEKQEAQLIAVYGRRRVGKTYLVRQTYGDAILFEHTGMYHGKLGDQLLIFRDSLLRHGATNVPVLRTWHDAFMELERFITSRSEQKKILFLDEFPWLDTPKSGFITAFEHFWNGWGSAQDGLVIIICGSATSWIIRKVLKNKGGLHNRVTGVVPLEPFTLAECKAYAEYQGLAYEESDIAEAYMIFGGIPYYWSYLRKDESLAQSVDRLLFSPNGKLRHEFSELLASLFNEDEHYLKIVMALAQKKQGLTQQDLLKITGYPQGGNFSKYLEELEQCGFIRRYTNWDKKVRNGLYQLLDNFVLFHLTFIKDESNQDIHFWQLSSASAPVLTWKGLAFERLCLLHSQQIKKALGISGVLTKIYSWRHTPDEVHPTGAQIDLLIERADNVINVCEMKWSGDSYTITKDVDANLRSKVETFRSVTNTRKAIHLTMVTTYGIEHNMYWNHVQSEVTLADLFTP